MSCFRGREEVLCPNTAKTWSNTEKQFWRRVTCRIWVTFHLREEKEQQFSRCFLLIKINRFYERNIRNICNLLRNRLETQLFPVVITHTFKGGFTYFCLQGILREAWWRFLKHKLDASPNWNMHHPEGTIPLKVCPPCLWKLFILHHPVSFNSYSLEVMEAFLLL